MAVTPQTNVTLAEIAQALQAHEQFCICGHVSPDGDCLGSQLALACALSACGKHVTCLLAHDEEIDRNLAFLPGADGLVPAKSYDGSCDVFVAVDVPTLERMGDAADVHAHAALSITIDHHAADERISDMSYTDPDAASTTLLIWELVKLLDAGDSRSDAIRADGDHADGDHADGAHPDGDHAERGCTDGDHVDDIHAGENSADGAHAGGSCAGEGYSGSCMQDLATCCYMGLMTDTGRFQFQNADARAFLLASEMVAAGADAADLARRFYQNRRIASVRLEGAVLGRMRLLADGAVALSWVTQADMAAFDAVKADAEPLVDALRSIAGVHVACILREHDDEVRVSLRSKDDTDVAAIARELGGGGHKAAAGCSVKKPIDDAVDLMAARLQALFADEEPTS